MIGVLTNMQCISVLQCDLIVRTNMRNMALTDLATEQGIWNMGNGIVSSKQKQSDNRRSSV